MSEPTRGIRALVLALITLCIVASLTGARAGQEKPGMRVALVDKGRLLSEYKYTISSDTELRRKQQDALVVLQTWQQNYLLPTDAKLERERDLLYEALPLENLLGEVAQAGKVGIVLLDSCRNNPFVERVSRSMVVAGRAVATSPGLARVDNVPRNTMVVMAAKADQIAEDGDAHSPFAAALLAHFEIPGLELSLFFRSVRDSDASHLRVAL